MQRLLLFLVALFFSAIALAAVNINTATQAELDALPGIGPVKSQAIIDYRKANGPFKTPEDIMKVSGIKEGEFAKLMNMEPRPGTSSPAMFLYATSSTLPGFVAEACQSMLNWVASSFTNMRL